KLVQEIITRKRTEEELAQYGHIVSSSTDMLAFLNKDAVYVAANKAYAEAFRKTPEEIIGRKVPEVFGEEFFYDVIRPNIGHALTGEEVHYEGWFEFPAYPKRFMEIAYYPHFDEINTITGLVVNGRNITERKNAENELKEAHSRMLSILDGLESIVYVTDMDTFEVLYPIFRTKSIPQCLIYTFPNTIYFKNFQIFCQIEYCTFSIAFMRSCSGKSENQLMS
ncbi:MAG: PAS domain-containing protein, partial [Planctomycetes bacterium]|nr:PAS domain-containing protein [Planctomycetota bacterium]